MKKLLALLLLSPLVVGEELLYIHCNNSSLLSLNSNNHVLSIINKDKYRASTTVTRVVKGGSFNGEVKFQEDTFELLTYKMSYFIGYGLYLHRNSLELVDSNDESLPRTHNYKASCKIISKNKHQQLYTEFLKRYRDYQNPQTKI
jgi:hypothetical protein